MTCEIWYGDSIELVHKINQPVHCVITDPPFGIGFVSHSAERPKAKQFVSEINGDKSLAEALSLWHQVFNPLSKLLVENADVYVFTTWRVLDSWALAVQAHGLNIANVLVWDKGTPGMGDVMGNYGNSYELIIYAKKGRRHVRERRSSIISVDRVDNKSHIHPTQKPVPLLEILIRQSTNELDLVVDPFSGSGSTIVAAQNLNRNAIGIENDLQYIRPSRERLTTKGLW